ncbi:hypothetical protein DIPPA_10792 [Diplonema papillatum]|nr:hypothetical protein DIPPA_10792 [Diplonema papillatum]
MRAGVGAKKGSIRFELGPRTTSLPASRAARRLSVSVLEQRTHAERASKRQLWDTCDDDDDESGTQDPAKAWEAAEPSPSAASSQNRPAAAGVSARAQPASAQKAQPAPGTPTASLSRAAWGGPLHDAAKLMPAVPALRGCGVGGRGGNEDVFGDSGTMSLSADSHAGPRQGRAPGGVARSKATIAGDPLEEVAPDVLVGSASPGGSILTFMGATGAPDAVRGVSGAEASASLLDGLSSLLSALRKCKPYLPHACVAELRSSYQPSALSENQVLCGMPVHRCTKPHLSAAKLLSHTVSARMETMRSGAGCASHSSSSTSASSMTQASTLHRGTVEPMDRQQQQQQQFVSNVNLTFSQARVAITVMNVLGSHHIVEGQGIAGYLDHFSDTLSAAITAVNECRGVTDIFIGDHIFSSFNSSRTCPSYSASAVRAACKVAGVCARRLNTGIAAGRTLCGVAGCEEMKRFTIIGRPTLLAPAYERQGRQLGVDILCDTSVHDDVWTFFETRLIPVKVTLDHLGDLSESVLWEVCTGWNPKYPRTEASEWMYEMQGNTGRWARYNEVADKYLRGEIDEALRVVSEAGSEPPCSRLASLLERIRSGCPPHSVLLQY